MSPMISDRTLDELRSRCDIVELIGSYVPLKRSGKNFTACCPFHEETKPSFMVNQERQIFKCFGCGKGGNVFHFIMQRERVGFFDSVRMIADRVGYELPVERPQASEGKFKKTDLFDVTAFAVNCFQGFLKDGGAGKVGMSYLLGRGITPETMEELKLGYAPQGSRLMKAAKEKGYSDELLLAAGLLAENQEGKLHDKFHNRVMFPVFNPQGRAIGFSGRALEDFGPKYMNSPETLLFNKSRVLYGLNFTRDEMMKEEHGVICEGHVDFIMLYQNGIRNAVAAQGTAFTDDQAKLLRRYAPKVTFAFDADAAGKKAVIRSLEPLLKAGLEVKVAEIPDGHDPDSFVREKGADEFRRLIASGRDYFDFQYDFLATENNANEQQGRLAIASEMLASVKKVPSEIVKDDLLQKLSQRMHISVDVLRNEMRKIRGDSRAFGQQQQETMKKKLTAEEELLEYALRFNGNLQRSDVGGQCRRFSTPPLPENREHCVLDGVRKG